MRVELAFKWCEIQYEGTLKDQDCTQLKCLAVHINHKPVDLPRRVAISMTFLVASVFKNSFLSPAKRYLIQKT